MAKYLINSDDIEIKEVSGTENLKFNLGNNNSIISRFELLHGTGTANSNNEINIDISYPTGFTKNNTFIVNGKINRSGEIVVYNLPMYWHDSSGSISSNSICILTDNIIELYCEGPVFSEGTIIEYWILIMKYE